MDGLTVIAFVFSMVGLVAFIKVEKLIETLKENRVLATAYKEE